MSVPCSDRRISAVLAKSLVKILPLRRWLLALSALIVIVVASPASAQTCKVINIPAFGTVEIANVVADDVTYSTTADFEYECKKDNHGPPPQKYTICMAIRNERPEQRYADNSHKFYQTQSGGARIGWRAQSDGGQGSFAGGAGTDSPLAPLIVTTNGNESTSKGKMRLKVIYLDRAQQDRVQKGTYTGEYYLVSQTVDDVHQCSSEPDSSKGNDGNRTPFTLTTTVDPTCRLENKGQQAGEFEPIDFGKKGSFDAASASAGTISATTNIDVRCTHGTDYTLKLGNGKNFDGTTRRMISNGKNYLAYELFIAGADGQSSSASEMKGKGTFVNAVTKHEVKGRLTTPTAVAPAAGDYADTVVVTLEF